MSVHRSPRLVAGIALVASVAGCYRWEAARPEAPLGDVRVTRVDGSMFELGRATWAGDSLVGHRRNGERVAVAKDSVRAIAVRHLDQRRTALLAVAGIALFAFGAHAPPGSGGP